MLSGDFANGDDWTEAPRVHIALGVGVQVKDAIVERWGRRGY